MGKTSLVVGITGQSGSGKTLVATLLSGYGFAVIDADIAARKVVELGRPALAELVEFFGKEITHPDGTLNRKKLADFVFTDESKKKTLESIIFPYIIRDIEEQIATFRLLGARGIFLDAPTLFESGADSICDKTIAVLAPREVRKQRILQRDGITPAQVESRLNAQNEDEYYSSRADFIIENGNKPEALKPQLLKIINELGLTV